MRRPPQGTQRRFLISFLGLAQRATDAGQMNKGRKSFLSLSLFGSFFLSGQHAKDDRAQRGAKKKEFFLFSFFLLHFFQTRIPRERAPLRTHSVMGHFFLCNQQRTFLWSAM